MSTPIERAAGDDGNFVPYGEPAIRLYAEHYGLEWARCEA